MKDNYSIFDIWENLSEDFKRLIQEEACNEYIQDNIKRREDYEEE